MLFKCLIVFFLGSWSLHALPGYCEPWGKDADLAHPRPLSSPTPRRLSPLAQIADLLIVFHQKVLTQADGPRSHFRPTSSRYMQLAIHRYGFFKGFIMGCDRLLRENGDPWVYRMIVIQGKRYQWDPIPQ